MCGITGWVDFERDLTGERETLDAMTRTMSCRGPDASGVFLAPHAGLGHRRLAVIDIEGGRQPMTVAEGEMVLRAYLQWGDAFVERLNGMFALAIWDTRREELLLVRDRLGIKPLYYAPTPQGVLFGSEPKAILAHPEFKARVDLDGVREMLAMVKTPERSPYSG